jgi:hypothetical protein
MSLGTHTKTGEGRFRKERADSLVKNLRKVYPELNNINGNTKLGTLEAKFGAGSLSGVLKAIRTEKKK